MTFQEAIGWTLLHFLWQATLVTAAFGLVNLAARDAASRLRYGLACASMLLLLACPILTLTLLLGRESMPAPAEGLKGTPTAALVTVLAPAPERLPDYLSLVVYAWICGVTGFALRLGLQWRALSQVRRRAVRLADPAWQSRLNDMAMRLGVRRLVELRESAIAAVPAVMGTLKPVILIPVGALARLAPEEMEALLVHELAHVLRHDYLVNLLQTAMETLFFYHPGVWWISRRMREERENCCDDIAVASCGDAIRYVRALAEMESLRMQVPDLAMAATGGALLRRAQRLLAPHAQKRGVAPSGVAVAALAVAALLLWAAPGTESKAQAAEPPSPPTPEAQAQTGVRDGVQGGIKTGVKGGIKEGVTGGVPDGQSYLDHIEQAGYRGLTVDQLVAMKIHGVTADFIRGIKGAGFNPSPEELVTMRIHGVDADYAGEWKRAGLANLTINQLVTLKIHGAQPGDLRQWRSLGYHNLDADRLVSLRIMRVTPAFAESAKKRGLGDLDLDKLIELKRMGILDRDTQ